MIGEKGRELFREIFREHEFQKYSEEGFLKAVHRYFDDYSIAMAQRRGEHHAGSCPTCGCRYLDPDDI